MMATGFETFRNPGRFGAAAIPLLAILLAPGAARPQTPTTMTHPVILRAVDENGAAISGFRYQVEEDPTLPVPLGMPVNGTLGTAIHKTYAPVAASGQTPGTSATVNLDPARKYSVTVLPDIPAAPTATRHQMCGTTVAGSATGVTLRCLTLPQKVAQIKVIVFQDNNSPNGAIDLPGEPGLAGFRLVVSDPLGPVSQDVFGNPLGTTYAADGSVAAMGNGIILTDANGEALIQNLSTFRYTVFAIPPQGTPWLQTTTIDGLAGIDAWVRVNEPPYFAETGAVEWHVWFGFTKPQALPTPHGPTGTIKGQEVFVHEMRPPQQPGLFPGEPVPECLVALSDTSNQDEQVYMGFCKDDSTFEIKNVPPGQYLLSLWDKQLRVVMDFRTVIIPGTGGIVDLGQVPVYAWRGTLSGTVFYDTNGNGVQDAGEPGIPDQPVNIRYPDGTMYQTTVSNPQGEYELAAVFPWFHWLVFETDITRFNPIATSLIVDDGGQTDPGKNYHAQPQPENAGLGYRVQDGLITEGMTLYAGGHNVANFGKQEYAHGTNGGISGTVTYEPTIAEDEARVAVIEGWSVGIPRVKVALYADANRDGAIDDLNGNGRIDLADIDNFPYGWQAGGPKGPEDEKRSGVGGPNVFDPGDALQIVVTDSFDDAPPTGCVGPDQFIHGTVNPDGTITGAPENKVMDCAETLPTYNQIRPAVYSGAYAFFTIVPGGLFTGGAEVAMPAGGYIVEAVPPLSQDGTRAYETQKEEDKNVTAGPAWSPNVPFLFPPKCVGDDHVVPDMVGPYLDQPSALPDLANPDGTPIIDPATGLPARPHRPLCDKKQVELFDRQNANANFFMLTPVPKGSLAWGMVFNDVLLEFDPTSPNAGGNFGVPWIPISFKDPTDHEIVRTYTDEWGKYNTMVPSSWAANVPTPTGFSPNVLSVCLNDPGPFTDSQGRLVLDPWYNPAYAVNCTNWDFWPGTTTDLDTPILPIAAFQGNATPLDCQAPDKTPLISMVDGPAGASVPGAAGTVGPLVATPNNNTQIAITAFGPMDVPNPDYDPAVAGSLPTITRDFGFGTVQGTVTVKGTAATPVSLSIVSWTASRIVARVPATVPSGELVVTRGDSKLASPMGVYLTVNFPASRVKRVHPCATNTQLPPPSSCSIQWAVDHANNNDLILVAPGLYKENVILYKRVKLQGYGAMSTLIQAGPMNPDETAAWDAKMAALQASGQVQVIPGERPDFFLERGAGITVAPADGAFTLTNNARVDGFTVTLAELGGGVFVNAYARYLELSNNRLFANQGSFGGGIRVGTPSVLDGAGGYSSSFNENLNIHHNLINQNGAIDGAGGVGLFNGTTRYSFTYNQVCGNFSLLYGGGIAHFGKSDRGVIDHNKIISNQAFDEGGGLIVAGELVPAGAAAGTLTFGAGNVQVSNNVIVANMAGDDGGGIRTLMVNGQDVINRPKVLWNQVQIFNNRITNNTSGDAGGGICLDDTLAANITHNTIAYNDSTATSSDAFGGTCVPGMQGGGGPTCSGEQGGGLTSSQPQVAGVASRPSSKDLVAVLPTNLKTANSFSNPVLANNIIDYNRSFYWDAAYKGPPPVAGQPALTAFGGLRPDVANGEAPVYWDLGVYGVYQAPVTLNAQNCLLTSTLGYASTNKLGNPQFVNKYVNVYKATSRGSALGNFVSVTFTPTGLRGDYHIPTGSAAINIGSLAALAASPVLLATDLNGLPRPSGTLPDAGAYERQAGTLPTLASYAEPIGGANGLLGLQGLRDHDAAFPQIPRIVPTPSSAAPKPAASGIRQDRLPPTAAPVAVFEGRGPWLKRLHALAGWVRQTNGGN